MSAATPAPGPLAPSVLRLAIPTPLRRLFDYLPPADADPETLKSLVAGTRIRVPFGRREVTGYLTAVVRETEIDIAQLKPALEILDDRSLIPDELYQLCRWAWSYYHHPPGEVFSALFPKRLRDGKPHQSLGEPAWRLSTQGKGLPGGALSRSPKQALALALLRESPAISTAQLSAQNVSGAVLRALRDKELIEPCLLHTPARTALCRASLELNPEQAATMAGLRRNPSRFSCSLLEGVTGSGKTEIYLQLIDDCLSRQEQALVLIPEIGLTPQTLSRFEARFDANIAVFHSGLSEGQRYQSWEAARDGSAHIVIGTRSAIFTPLARLGLIVVDEEHDASYKQQDGFRYAARDVAVKRAQLEDCPVLLGSATPSLESIHNASTGRYEHYLLQTRAGSAVLPRIEVEDVRKQPLQAGLSPRLIETVQKTITAGEQVLLFLNRRGYAPTLQCHDCGWIAECEACDARLTVHRGQRRLRCHHCGAARPIPATCPTCHSNALLGLGLGTEQTETFLRAHFPETEIYRVDSDSMRGREAMAALVEQINTGRPCILLGTAMLTKGHHFPSVTLVAVIDSDAMLFSGDFRGEERMAQLLTQVAGRAGREATGGTVVLQSHHPDHPLLQAMLTHSYAQQARDLLRDRQERGLPPAGQLVIVRSDCSDPHYAETYLQTLRQHTEATLPPGSNYIGPLPAPMQRRAGRFRCQLLLSAPDRRCAQAAASQIVAAAESISARHGLKWSIDIDPQEIF